MKKGLKYTLVSLGSLVVLAGIGLGIMYVLSPYKVKRWLGIASSCSDVFVDRLKGQPYTRGGYDGIDVSKHNGVIKWKEIAKNKRIKFVYIRATHGKGYVDRHKNNASGDYYFNDCDYSLYLLLYAKKSKAY